jgi:hypothetical protein
LRIICIFTQLAVLANAVVRPPGAAGSGKKSGKNSGKNNETLLPADYEV